LFWTDRVQHIRPEVDGFELYYTSFPLLIKQGYQDGERVCYRTRHGFALLKQARLSYGEEKYCVFLNNIFNVDTPKGYNFILGYSDNGNNGSDCFPEDLYNKIEQYTDPDE